MTQTRRHRSLNFNETYLISCSNWRILSFSVLTCRTWSVENRTIISANSSDLYSSSKKLILSSKSNSSLKHSFYISSYKIYRGGLGETAFLSWIGPGDALQKVVRTRWSCIQKKSSGLNDHAFCYYLSPIHAYDIRHILREDSFYKTLFWWEFFMCFEIMMIRHYAFHWISRNQTNKTLSKLNGSKISYKDDSEAHKNLSHKRSVL